VTANKDVSLDMPKNITGIQSTFSKIDLHTGSTRLRDCGNEICGGQLPFASQAVIGRIDQM
jgi:hypothetical protein